jgi:hypothetical protein
MFSIAVRMRDKVCQICGGTFELCAHHILRKGSYAAHKFDVDNGILLCRDCHGGKNNGPHGFKGDVPFMCWLAMERSSLHEAAIANARESREFGDSPLRMAWYEDWSAILAEQLEAGDWEAYIPPNAAKWKVKLVHEYMEARQ